MRFYSLRLSLLPTVDFNERVSALLDFCDKALIDDVMFFIAPEEVHVGHITLEEAKKYADVIGKASAELKKRGIGVSLNPWCTLVHYDGGRKLKNGQNFRTMTGADGVKAEVAVCPLDKSWREYYAELLNFYVETLRPDILWFEDDMRLSNHEPVAHGCFCEEHLRRYNARLNTNYTREEFVKRIFTDKDARKAYLDIAGLSIEDTLSFLVNRLKNQRKFGLMTGGTGFGEGRKNKKLFSILAQNGEKPYDRLCLYSYRQRGSQEYAWSFNKQSMAARFAVGNAADCVSEMEDFPHSYYTKTAGYVRKQMLTSVPLCLSGDTFSIFDFCGNGVNHYERYAKVLREVKPYLSRVSGLGLCTEDMRGVRVLLSEDSAYYLKGGDFKDLSPEDSWLFAYLTQLGIACAYTFDRRIKNQAVGVSGQVLRGLSDEDITALFLDNFVIITADNIAVLKERNLLRLIGAVDFEIYPERTGKHSIEELATGEKIFGMSKFRATCQFFCGDYYRIVYDGDCAEKESKTYTNILDYEEKIAGSGIRRVKNALIFPYANTDSELNVPISLICPLRAHAMKSALGENAVNRKELFFVREENVCIYVYEKAEAYYLAAVNFGDDDYKVLHITINAEFCDMQMISPRFAEVRAVEWCEINGNRQSKNHEFKIKTSLGAFESAVLILKKHD